MVWILVDMSDIRTDCWLDSCILYVCVGILTRVWIVDMRHTVCPCILGVMCVFWVCIHVCIQHVCRVCEWYLVCYYMLYDWMNVSRSMYTCKLCTCTKYSPNMSVYPRCYVCLCMCLCVYARVCMHAVCIHVCVCMCTMYMQYVCTKYALVSIPAHTCVNMQSVNQYVRVSSVYLA